MPEASKYTCASSPFRCQYCGKQSVKRLKAKDTTALTATSVSMFALHWRASIQAF